MDLGIGLGITRRQGGGGGAASFETWVSGIFAGSVPGVAYAPSPSTCYTDVGLTTPATVGAASGTIYVRDISGNAKTLTVTNAVLNTEGGRYYLTCNGTTTGGVTAAVDFSATDKLTLWLGIQKASDAAAGCLLELSASASSNVGSFAVFAPGSAAPQYNFKLRGDGSVTDFFAATYTAPILNVLSLGCDLAGAARASEMFPRVNGVIPTLTTGGAVTAGAGNFGAAYPLYFFSRGGSSLRFNGRFYGGVVLGAQVSAGQISAGESYLATMSGVTL